MATVDSGCPFCSNRIICGFLNCIPCFTKSCYIYKDIWSTKNELNPEEVCLYSNKKYWFKCKECSHDYKQEVSGKTSNNRGCPYCSNQKLCGTVECKNCLPKSCYVYKDIWSSKNKLNPENVFMGGDKKVWFNCNVCMVPYLQIVHNKKSGKGCSRCVYKTEKKVDDFLKNNNIGFTSQFKINSNKRHDFLLHDFKLIIEVDGPQHFEKVSNWKGPTLNLENDIQKMKIALENGYSVLRIYQPDIWNDNVDWRQIIFDNMYAHIEPEIICISSVPGIYNNHQAPF